MGHTMPWHSPDRTWEQETSWNLPRATPDAATQNRITGRQWRDAKLFHSMYHYSLKEENSSFFDNTWLEVYSKAINVRGIVVGSSDQDWPFYGRDGKHGKAVEAAGFRSTYTEDDNVAMVRELIRKIQAEARASGGAPADYLDDVVVIPWTRYDAWLKEFEKFPRGAGTDVPSVQGADVERVFFKDLRDMAGRTVV